MTQILHVKFDLIEYLAFVPNERYQVSRLNKIKILAKIKFFSESHLFLQIWRYFTYILIHIDVLHLLSNIGLQLLAAALIEGKQGWHRVVCVYLGSALMGSLGSFFDLEDLMKQMLLKSILNFSVDSSKLKYYWVFRWSIWFIFQSNFTYIVGKILI